MFFPYITKDSVLSVGSVYKIGFQASDVEKTIDETQ